MSPAHKARRLPRFAGLVVGQRLMFRGRGLRGLSTRQSHMKHLLCDGTGLGADREDESAASPAVFQGDSTSGMECSRHRTWLASADSGRLEFTVVSYKCFQRGRSKREHSLCPSLSFHVKPPALWPFPQSLGRPDWSANELTLPCPAGAERAVAVPAAPGRGAQPAPGQRPRGAEVPQVSSSAGLGGTLRPPPHLLVCQSQWELVGTCALAPGPESGRAGAW